MVEIIFTFKQKFTLYATFFSGVWIKALRSLPTATSEVASAIESYHRLLKIRLLNEEDQNVYQRADWLVQKLSTDRKSVV